MRKSLLTAGIIAAQLLVVLPNLRAQAPDAKEQEPGGLFRRMFQRGRENNPEPDRLRAQAEDAYQRQDYRKTVELCTQILEIDPKSPFAYYQRGSARVELGRAARSLSQIREGIADARQALQLAGKLHPSFYIPYLYGLTSLAEIEGKSDNAALAIQIVTPVIEKGGLANKDLSPLLYQRALASMVTRDYSKVVRDSQEAVQLNPDFLAAYLLESQGYVAIGDVEKAKESYKRSVEMFPQMAIVYNNRGTFLQQIGESAAAERDYDRAIQLSPQFAVSYVNRGYARTSQKKFKSAESDFLMSLKIDPNQSLVHQLLGSNRLSQGNWKGAISDFSNAIRLTPNSVDLHAGRGYARFFGKEYTAAAGDFEKALELNPAAKFLFPWRCLAWTEAKHAAGAASQLSKALAAGATPEWTTKVCEYLLDKLGEAELIEAANAEGVHPKSERLCEAHFFIGQRKESKGDVAEAQEHYRQCLKTGAFQSPTYDGATCALSAKAPPAGTAQK